MDPLSRLERGIKVPMPSDEEGLIGRECPNPECLGYFKVKFGTGLTEPGLPCHCPYCGYTAEHDQFWSQDQIEYALSIFRKELGKAIGTWARNLNQDLQRRTRKSFVKLSISYKESTHPIRYYREKELETRIACDSCTLEYAIYGVFAHCPDCGKHNSMQILCSNLALVGKELAMAAVTEDREFSAFLRCDALENVVSAFDGFGRQLTAMNASKASIPEQAEHLSFQNIDRAREKVRTLFGFDFADCITQDEWDSVSRSFQKRHVVAHRMGVVDQTYVDATGDRSVVVGRKMPIAQEEVEGLMVCLEKIGERLTQILC
jgi:hypothetical protein